MTTDEQDAACWRELRKMLEVTAGYAMPDGQTRYRLGFVAILEEFRHTVKPPPTVDEMVSAAAAFGAADRHNAVAKP